MSMYNFVAMRDQINRIDNMLKLDILSVIECFRGDDSGMTGQLLYEDTIGSMPDNTVEVNCDSHLSINFYEEIGTLTVTYEDGGSPVVIHEMRNAKPDDHIGLIYIKTTDKVWTAEVNTIVVLNTDNTTNVCKASFYRVSVDDKTMAITGTDYFATIVI